MQTHGQTSEDPPLQNHTLLPYAGDFFRKHGLSIREGEERAAVGLFRSMMREAVENKFMGPGIGVWKRTVGYLSTRFGLSHHDAENFVGYVTRYPTPTK